MWSTWFALLPQNTQTPPSLLRTVRLIFSQSLGSSLRRLDCLLHAINSNLLNLGQHMEVGQLTNKGGNRILCVVASHNVRVPRIINERVAELERLAILNLHPGFLEGPELHTEVVDSHFSTSNVT